MTDSSSFADAVAAEAARHSASRRLREADEAKERAFIIAEVSDLAAEVFPVLRQRVDLAVPVVRQVNPTWPQGGWVEVGHVWDLDLLGMRSTGEFTSKLTIRQINVEEWRGGSLPSSARDPFTGKLRFELEGNDAPLAPDSPGFFSTFGVARNGEIGIMDAWGAETYVAARAALASRIGRLMATGSAR